MGVGRVEGEDFPGGNEFRVREKDEVEKRAARVIGAGRLLDGGWRRRV